MALPFAFPQIAAVHDGTITTTRVNEMWGTDMTATFTVDEGQAAIFFAVDHCSLECVGIHADAERFVRILKENLPWVRTFSTVEELRQALLEFQRTYNHNWIIQRHGYKTPAQVRLEQSRAMSLAA